MTNKDELTSQSSVCCRTGLSGRAVGQRHDTSYDRVHL